MTQTVATTRRLPMIPRALAAWGDLRGAMRAELAERPGDGRLLGYLIVALLINWASAIPLNIKAAGGDASDVIGMGFVANVFMAPLLFYALAALLLWCGRVFGGKAGFYEHRLALFWGFLVATPVVVLANAAQNLLGGVVIIPITSDLINAITSDQLIGFAKGLLTLFVLGTCMAETNGAKPLWRGVGQVLLPSAVVITVSAMVRLL
ncbi:MAG: hypothetical protein ACI9ZM_000909 [Paracoccaceae bacterium]